MVFCLEGVDNRDGRVDNLIVPDGAPLGTEFRSDLLGGVQVIKGTALPAKRTLAGDVVAGEKQEFTAIPYFAWANRDRCEMTVWPAREKEYARALPAPTPAFLSKATASGGRNPEVIKYQMKPESSLDPACPYMHWWPKKGSTEWVQYDFADTTTVGKAEVYWFDDTGSGECRIPVAWRILYKDGDQWKPVENPTSYDVRKDQFNTVSFKPVKTSALRLEVDLPKDFSAGIYTWNVE